MPFNIFIVFFFILYPVGNNIICVKSMDNEVKFKTQGCEEFEISPSDTLNLKSLEKNAKISLKAVKYSVSGRVNSKESKISDLKVIAKSETRLVELELEPLENDVGYRSIIFRNSLLSTLPQYITLISIQKLGVYKIMKTLYVLSAP